MAQRSKLIATILAILLRPVAAYSREYQFVDSVDDRSTFQRFGEPFFTIISAYHVQSVPHEAVHAGVAYTFGTKTKYWTVKPLLQSVHYAKEDSKRRREDVFSSSMAAPIFSRFTADLPRWLHDPSGRGYWSRWTSAYWLMSTTSIWVTLAGSWDAFSRNDGEAGWDFNNARQALTDSKRDQALFLSSLTALLSFDVYCHWDDYRNNLHAFAGRKAVIVKEGSDLSFGVVPNGIKVVYRF